MARMTRRTQTWDLQTEILFSRTFPGSMQVQLRGEYKIEIKEERLPTDDPSGRKMPYG